MYTGNILDPIHGLIKLSEIEKWILSQKSKKQSQLFPLLYIFLFYRLQFHNSRSREDIFDELNALHL